MSAPDDPEVEAVRRLALWARREGLGLARIIGGGPLGLARIERALAAGGGPQPARVALPVRGSPSESVAALRDELVAVGAGLVLVTGWDALDALPAEDATNLLASVVLAREVLAALPCRQVWWVGRGVAAETLTRTVDLDDWFDLRLDVGLAGARVPLVVHVLLACDAESQAARSALHLLVGALRGRIAGDGDDSLHGMDVPVVVTRDPAELPEHRALIDAERRQVVVLADGHAEGWEVALLDELRSDAAAPPEAVALDAAGEAWVGRDAVGASLLGRRDDFLFGLLPTLCRTAGAGVGMTTLFDRAVERPLAEIVPGSAVVAVCDGEPSAALLRRFVQARRADLPVVVALREGPALVARPSPLLGSVPTQRADGIAHVSTRTLTVVMQEVLRHAVFKRRVRPPPGGVVLATPPDLLGLSFHRDAEVVIYPDPPLPAVEREILAGTGLRLTTPLLEAAGGEGALVGVSVGLSVSEATDETRWGAPAGSAAHAVGLLARLLRVAGAGLAWGGFLDVGWLADLLRDVEAEHGAGSGAIRSYVGWPLQPGWGDTRDRSLSAEQLRLPRPADPRFSILPSGGGFGSDSALHRLAWASGLTATRERMARECTARAAFGGRVDGGYVGRWPGVVEEVVFALRAGQPIFLAGGFGGATRALVDVLYGADPAARIPPGPPPGPFGDELREQYGDAWEDAATALAPYVGRQGEALHNGLTAAENDDLCFTPDPRRAVELILTGLRRLTPEGRSTLRRG